MDGTDSGEDEFTLATSFEYDFCSFPEAKQMYEKAILKGHKLAQFNLALWYLYGNRPGTKKDLVKAKELFQLSADQGLGISMYNLGTLYEQGVGDLPRDERAAFKLYKKAAKENEEWPEDGKRRVFIKLSQMYQNGTGTTSCIQKAAYWMERANEEKALPPSVMSMMKMLKQLDPGKVQTENDKRWRRLSKYVDGLAQAEKPSTFKCWEKLFLKFGYVPSNPRCKKPKQKARKCSLSEFMELSGGSFKTLDTFEMQDEPEPPPICAYCRVEEQPDKKLKNCARCREKYCSKECQKKDWKTHKEICNMVSDQINIS